ncbi:MAG: hypothetical protein D6775_07595 [Caldilineae bacterium]|nr:MAG: hypothetical protein D6775_07595 [Caldilineae bacterium]
MSIFRVFLSLAAFCVLLYMVSTAVAAKPESHTAAVPATGSSAAAIVVDTLQPGVAADGKCSITEAILNANGDDQSGSTDCAAGSGADTIVLPHGGEILLRNAYSQETGLPPITSHIIIEGHQTRLRRSSDPGTPSFRFFRVKEQGFLELADVALEGGRAATGGAISNAGTLTLRGVVIRGNTGDRGGGIYGVGKTSILQSRVVENQAQDGGGVLNDGGELVIEKTRLQGNRASERGGAILNTNGVMTMTFSSISGNSAQDGGGLAVEGEWGLSPDTYRYASRVDIRYSHFVGNTADRSGGGLYSLASGGAFRICETGYGGLAEIAILQTEFRQNTSHGDGGAIALSTSGVSEGAGRSRLSIRQSVISDNEADGNGGGVANHAGGWQSCEYGDSAYGKIDIQETLITGNRAKKRGGGLANAADKATYGMFPVAWTVVRNSTLSGNHAGEAGGGISNEAPQNDVDSNARVHLIHATVTQNQAPQGGGLFHDVPVVRLWEGEITPGVVISNTIVAAQQVGGDCSIAQNAVLQSGGYNLESADSCGFTATGDLQNTDPLLEALADNGGPTETHALKPNSPALDHIPAGVNGCTPQVSTDQRGALRASGNGQGGAACDAGSFEAMSTPPAACIPDIYPPDGDYVFPPPNAHVTPPLLLAAAAEDEIPGMGLETVRFTWAPPGGPWQRIDGCQFEDVAQGEHQFDCIWDMAEVPDGRLSLGIEVHDRAGLIRTHTRPLVKVSGQPDVTPPEGDMTAPERNSVQSPPVHLAAQAADDVGVGMVRFTAEWGGTWHRLALDGQPPYAFDWDMAGVPDGPVTVGVEIYDRAGNKAPSPPWRTRRFSKQTPPEWTPTPSYDLCTFRPTPTPTPTLTPTPTPTATPTRYPFSLWLPLMLPFPQP